MISPIPPILGAHTGTPTAPASIITRPNASGNRVDKTNISESIKILGISERIPKNFILSSKFNSFTN